MSTRTEEHKCTACKKIFHTEQKLQGHEKIFHEGKISEFRKYKIGTPALLASYLNYLALEVPNLQHLMPVAWDEAWSPIRSVQNPNIFPKRFFKSLCKPAVLHLTVRTHLVPCTEHNCSQIQIGAVHPRRNNSCVFPSYWCIYRGDEEYCPGYPGVRRKVDCGWNLPRHGHPVVHLYNSQPLGRDNCIATKTVVLDYSKEEKSYDVSRLAAKFARKNIISYDDAYSTQF